MEEKSNRLIRPVEDHDDKRLTYQVLLAKYKKATQNGFFFESLLIDYACMEDRLRYLLYYLGVLYKENDYKIVATKSERIKTIKTIVHKYNEDDDSLGISSISGKIKIIKSILLFSNDQEETDNGKKYQVVIKNKLDDVKKNETILELLEDVESWCKYRNEVIHSLMNKNLMSLEEHLKEEIIEGYRLFREMDKHNSWIKRRNIRGELGLYN